MINYEISFLDPANSFEASTIADYNSRLEYYIELLESSIKASVRNSKIKLIDSISNTI